MSSRWPFLVRLRLGEGVHEYTHWLLIIPAHRGVICKHKSAVQFKNVKINFQSYFPKGAFQDDLFNLFLCDVTLAWFAISRNTARSQERNNVSIAMDPMLGLSSFSFLSTFYFLYPWPILWTFPSIPMVVIAADSVFLWPPHANNEAHDSHHCPTAFTVLRFIHLQVCQKPHCFTRQKKTISSTPLKGRGSFSSHMYTKTRCVVLQKAASPLFTRLIQSCHFKGNQHEWSCATSVLKMN